MQDGGKRERRDVWQVVVSQTIYVGVILFLSYLFAISCYFLIYDQSVPYVIVEAFSFSSYCFFKDTICIFIPNSYSSLCLSCNLSQT